MIHHHLVSIPGTGRERNIITDAGDILAQITEIDVDIVLSGHKHVPFFWGVNGILICNSGTVTTKRVRGLTPPSWNEIQIDATTIKVYLHYSDGRRELSLIFSRKTRAMTREAVYMTPDFLNSNRIFTLT
jgi:3',5'-cyclic AMP phosphodiesterase CpdA